MNNYYETTEIDDLVYLLEKVKRDEEKVLETQKYVKNTCHSWVLRYINEDAKSKSDFENVTNQAFMF